MARKHFMFIIACISITSVHQMNTAAAQQRNLNIGQAILTATIQAPSSVNVAAPFSISWSGPGRSTDYISIARSDQHPGAYVQMAWIADGNPANIHAPSEPGTYDVRYILGEGDRLLATVPITVNAVAANVKAPASVDAEAKLMAQWEGPGYESDYISIAQLDQHPGAYVKMAWIIDGNPLKIQAPSKPGTYEIRYILGQGDKLLAKSPIVVRNKKQHSRASTAGSPVSSTVQAQQTSGITVQQTPAQQQKSTHPYQPSGDIQSSQNTGGHLYPDFEISDVAYLVNPERIAARIRNNGAVPFEGSLELRVGVIDPDGSYSVAYDVSVPSSLQPGAQVWKNMVNPFNWPSPLEQTRLQFTVHVDSQQTVTETDETNNTFQKILCIPCGADITSVQLQTLPARARSYQHLYGTFGSRQGAKILFFVQGTQRYRLDPTEWNETRLRVDVGSLNTGRYRAVVYCTNPDEGEAYTGTPSEEFNITARKKMSEELDAGELLDALADEMRKYMD